MASTAVLMAHDSVKGEMGDVAPALLLTGVVENPTEGTWGKLRRYLAEMQLGDLSGSTLLLVVS